jgi:hypothetical protein
MCSNQRLRQNVRILLYLSSGTLNQPTEDEYEYDTYEYGFTIGKRFSTMHNMKEVFFGLLQQHTSSTRTTRTWLALGRGGTTTGQRSHVVLKKPSVSLVAIHYIC